MSDPFSRLNNSMTSAGDAARFQAGQKALEAKQKLFEKKKTIEEGLSGFKAFTGGRTIAKAALDNLGPYVKQEAKASYNQFKDQWSKEISERANRYIRKNDPWSNEATGGGRPSNVEPSNSDPVAASEESPALDELGDETATAAVKAVKAEPETDTPGLLSEEVGEAGVTKVGSTLNPFNLGGEGTQPAASASSNLETITEDAGAEERATTLSQQTQEIRQGIQTLKDQQQSLNEGLSKLGNANKVEPPGSSAANETSDAAIQAEKEAGEKADQALADKLAARTAEKTAAETSGEDASVVTGEEAVGGFLDDTGILAPLGLLIGAVGLGTAAEEAKKKKPLLNLATNIGDSQGGTSYQAGIN